MPSPNTPFLITVQIQDPDGDVCANGEADIPCIVSIGTFPEGSEAAVLNGTLTKTPTAGEVTFDDLTIDLPGVGYTLNIEAVDPVAPFPDGVTSLASVECTAFNIYDAPPQIIVHGNNNFYVGFNIDGTNSVVYDFGSTAPNLLAGYNSHNEGEPILLMVSDGSELQLYSASMQDLTLESATGIVKLSNNAIHYDGAFYNFEEFLSITSYSSPNPSAKIINFDGASGGTKNYAGGSFVTGASVPTACQTVAVGSGIYVDDGGGDTGDPQAISFSFPTYAGKSEHVYQSAIQTISTTQIAVDGNYIYRCIDAGTPTIEVGIIGGTVIVQDVLTPFVAASSAEFDYGPILATGTHLLVMLNDKTATPIIRTFVYDVSDFSVTEITGTINRQSALALACSFIDRSRMVNIT